MNKKFRFEKLTSDKKLFCRWCKKRRVTVVRICQNPFVWQRVIVLAIQSVTIRKKMTDKSAKKRFYVTVCKDTSYTNQLGPWSNSLFVNAQTIQQARCELIVEANDKQVKI